MENALSALATVDCAFGLDAVHFDRLRTFRGLEHRQEIFYTHDHPCFTMIKATTPEATISALRAFDDRPLH